MNIPKITIITPVYNAENYIRESIESILNQSFKKFEYIIIDNASTDQTWTIIKSYLSKDPRIVAVRNETNLGIAGNRNKALIMAKGEYIAWQDADDISTPPRLDEQYNFLEKNHHISLVGGGYAPFNETGHRTNIFHPTSSMEIAWRFVSNMYFANPTVMFRSEILKVVGLMPNVGAEDYAFLSKIVRNYRCVNLRKILIKYREHQKNYSVTAKSGILESIKNTFNENFFYYTGSLKYAETFYRYQTKNRLFIKDCLKINRINLIILKKIKKQYKISNFSTENLKMMILIQKINLFAILGSIKDTLLKNFLQGT